MLHAISAEKSLLWSSRPGSLTLGCHQGLFLSRMTWRICAMPLPQLLVAAGPLWLVPSVLTLAFMECGNSPFLQRCHSHSSRPHPNLVTSAMTLVPNKMACEVPHLEHQCGDLGVGAQWIHHWLASVQPIAWQSSCEKQQLTGQALGSPSQHWKEGNRRSARSFPHSALGTISVSH